MASIDEILKQVRLGLISEEDARTIYSLTKYLNKPVLVVSQDGNHRMGGVLIETPAEDTIRIQKHVHYALLRIEPEAETGLCYHFLDISEQEKIIKGAEIPILVLKGWYNGGRRVDKPGEEVEGSVSLRKWEAKYLELWADLYEQHLKNRKDNELFIERRIRTAYGG